MLCIVIILGIESSCDDIGVVVVCLDVKLVEVLLNYVVG